jgi:Circadian oscillating protein COP23
MNQKLFSNILLTSSILLISFQGNIVQAQSKKNTYKCINNKGVPTTIVDTPRGRIQLITWKSDFFRSSGWTPQKRCEEVTNRFQNFSNNGTLKYVTTGIVDKKYKVICVGKKIPGQGYSCIKDGLLITLQPEDNSNDILKNLFGNAARVGGVPVTRGQYAISMDAILNDSEVEETTTEEIKPNPVTTEKEDTIQIKKEESEENSGINIPWE